MIDAAEAHRIGLANRVVPAGTALVEARALLTKILANGPVALRLALESVEHGSDASMGDGLTLAARTSEAQSVPASIRQAIDAGAYASAESLAAKWVASAESDPVQRLRAENLLVESLVRNGKGASSSTVILARHVLRGRERVLGRSHIETAESLHTFGMVRAARGEFAQATPLFDRALAVRRMALGPDHPRVADTLDQLASVLIQLERFPDAKVRLDASMRIREARASQDDIGLSRTRVLVGTLYRLKAA
jgi:hypothetical protein